MKISEVFAGAAVSMLAVGTAFATQTTTTVTTTQISGHTETITTTVTKVQTGSGWNAGTTPSSCPAGSLVTVGGISYCDTTKSTTLTNAATKTTTVTNVETRWGDFTDVTGNCPSNKVNSLGKCTLSAASSPILMQNPDQTPADTGVVTIGDYVFTADPGATIKWIYGPAATIGGGIGAISLDYNTPLVTISRVDGQAFSVGSFTVHSANMNSASAPDLALMGIHNGVETATDTMVPGTNGIFYGTTDPTNAEYYVYNDVSSFIMDGAAQGNWTIRDFSFKTVSTMQSVIQLPVPEVDRAAMTATGLFGLFGFAAMRRRREARRDA